MKKQNTLMALLLLLIMLAPQAAFSEEEGGGSAPAKGKPLYRDSTDDGRELTVNMMESIIQDEVDRTLTVDEEGKPTGGKYMKVVPQTTDVLSQVKKELESLGNEEAPKVGPNFHKYDRGTNEGEISINHEFDKTMILGGEFYGCMNYNIIGTCLQVMPDFTVQMMPYVQYYGPPQKVENVDQPLKTGYLEKEKVKEIIDEHEDGDYYRFANLIALGEMVYSGVVSVAEFSKRDLTLSDPEDPTGRYSEDEITQKAVDDLKAHFPKDARFRHLDPTYNSGSVYNEYHLMPTGIDLRDPEPFAKAILDPIVEAALIWVNELAIEHGGGIQIDPFIHVTKLPVSFFSDEPIHIFAARSVIPSIRFFPFLMLERMRAPLGCPHFNVKPREGRKLNFDPYTDQKPAPFFGEPADMLEGLLHPGDKGIVSGEACQGVNQAPWLPVLNTTQTAFHTTAAAVGTVKGVKIAHAYYPETNYDYTYDNVGIYESIDPEGEVVRGRDGDKVQWIRNELMDGYVNGTDKYPDPYNKKCNSVEKWVLKYGDANTKVLPDDHWNVVAQWRMWRGCLTIPNPPFPPVPVFPAAPQVFE